MHRIPLKIAAKYIQRAIYRLVQSIKAHEIAIANYGDDSRQQDSPICSSLLHDPIVTMKYILGSVFALVMLSSTVLGDKESIWTTSKTIIDHQTFEVLASTTVENGQTKTLILWPAGQQSASGDDAPA